MSKSAIYALIICQSIVMALANDLDAQRKQLSELEINLPEYQGDVKLSTLIKDIEEVSSFEFAYTQSLVRGKELSIHGGVWNMEDLLKEVSSSSKISIKRVNEVISLTESSLNSSLPKISEQIYIQQTVTGKVTDENGEPLPGATVLEMGTTNGTITDVDGKFSLSVNEGVVILVSFVGYKPQEVQIGSETFLNISMVPDYESLEEVVVVGYGTQRKSDLTGSVTSIKSEEISNVPVARLDQSLQGKAAGVQVTSVNGAPGSGTTIRIRGGNSINASNEPLYVIDGFIGGGDLNTINMNDIESVEILKDAAATSIYGARGANGVILVTTKRGQQGTARVSVNSYYGVQKLANKIDFLNGYERALYAQEHAAFIGQDNPFPDLSTVSDVDWQEVMTNDAPVANTDVSISGGNSSVKYFLSGNYFKQDGIIINSGFARYQTRLNLDAKFNKWLSVGTTMNISRTNRNNNKVNFYNLLKESPPTTPVYNEDGSYNEYNNLNSGYFNNQKAEADLVKDNTYLTRLLGNYFVMASFENGLIFKSSLGTDLSYGKTNRYEPVILPRRLDQGLGGYARVSTSTTVEILNENTVNYMKDFGDHSINLLGGATYQHSQTESLWASGNGFTNDLLEYNKLSTGDPLQRDSDSGFNDWTILSFLGRANYSYNDKYLFTLVGRYDGSSRLAQNHKWAFFPSAAVAWRLIEEDFIKNLGIFSDLKVRASIGKSGNQAISTYSTLPSLQVNSVYFNSTEAVGLRTGNISNPDLKWETTDQFDLGLEAGFFKGRLSFELDYYYKKTKDLLLSVEIPGQTGYSSRLDNIGELQNQGLELMINAVPVDRKNFSWDLAFNISGNRNEVLSLGDKDFVDVATGSRLIVGEPAIVFYGMVQEGVWHTQEEIDASSGYMSNVQPGFAKFKDVDGDGVFDPSADRDILGSPQPSFFGGLQNTMKYKNFDLSFYLQGTFGNEILSEFANRLYYGDRASNIHAMTVDRWTETNTSSNIPRAGYFNYFPGGQYGVSTISVQDGSFLRLKTLRVGYTIPTSKVSWVQSAKIYVIGTNLFCLNNYDWGYDPEVNSRGTNSILRGYDNYSYPPNRSFTVGFNVEF